MSTNIIVWEKAILDAESAFTEIATLDGNLISYKREASFAMQAMQGPNGDYLKKCTPESIRNAVVNVAAVGLSLSPALKLAYLVPRKLKEDGPVSCCLDISYMGLCHLAVESGAVLAVMAETVRANDRFEYVNGFTHPNHKFTPFASVEERGDIIGVYCVARLKSGVDQVETLSMEEIAKIRSSSKVANGPWKSWFEEMAKKSVIKRAAKLWPRADRLARAIEVVNEHEGDEGIVVPQSSDANPADVERAKSEVEQREAVKAGLRKGLDNAKTVDDARAIWSASLEYCNGSRDKEFYDEMKAKVSVRVGELKKPAEVVQ